MLTETLQRCLLRSTLCLLALLLVSVSPSLVAQQAPTPDEAEAFLVGAEEKLLERVIELSRAQWVQSNFITEDTDILAATAYERLIAETMAFAKEATRFNGLDLPYDTERRLRLLKLGLTLPAPDNAEQRAELTQIAAGMESAYGRGKYCSEDGECRALGELSRTMASSRDADELLEAWTGWRSISPPMRDQYQRFAELGNKGAQELGFADLGALWRAKYDMAPDAFRAELDRLWDQVRPLYESLHCYVRSKLSEQYGADVVPDEGPIPAHVLGNMWAQTWGNIYDVVAPATGDPGFDLAELLTEKGVDAREMVRYGERFFTSLGFEPLPESFWERSLFTKPADREVVCHASAWDIDQVDDIRIKMCIEINAEDFSTVHHELGHNFYQRAYSIQPYFYRDSANDGFHEGVGDAVALSVTPEYLVEVGLLNEAPDESADLGVLLKMALDKVAFLPFGLVVDQWRWQVFSGEASAEEYNEAWWKLREKYQGVRAPVARSEADFDPGAKYHVPANTPYTRYFLAAILQFQFQRGLCETAGFDGPLHRCSIYGNEEAGEKLMRMLEMGSSRPWPDALEAVTGQREMDATAILDYFAPLQGWLDEQNAGSQCGW
jgi:peptidyl-dipeptidase A